MHVGKVLSETAKRIPQKTAVIFKDEEITFSQLELMVTRLANKLRSCKVGSGDHVAIILPNSSQWVVSYFAVMKLGAVAVPLDFRLKGEEIDCLFTGGKHQNYNREEDASFSRYEDVVGDESLIGSGGRYYRRGSKLYLYTSGTTGKPKGWS